MNVRLTAKAYHAQFPVLGLTDDETDTLIMLIDEGPIYNYSGLNPHINHLIKLGWAATFTTGPSPKPLRTSLWSAKKQRYVEGK